MEDEHQDLTTRLNETTSGATTVNIHEVSNLQPLGKQTKTNLTIFSLFF